MKKLLVIFVLALTTSFTSACVASRKFVRNEVKTTSDTLNSRIDTTDSEVKETQDGVNRVDQKVGAVDSRVTELDSKTTQLKGDLQATDEKAAQANSAVQHTAGELAALDEKFQGRNNFSVAAEKSVQFRFDSAKLDANFKTSLDEVAEMIMANPDAIVVLEGRTDSTGDSEYNVRLGERRVEAVRRYLAVDKNIPVYRIHVISLGDARPIASNDSRDGREKNRAVTISVLAPAASGPIAAQ